MTRGQMAKSSTAYIGLFLLLVAVAAQVPLGLLPESGKIFGF